jgi:hypothetical protein
MSFMPDGRVTTLGSSRMVRRQAAANSGPTAKSRLPRMKKISVPRSARPASASTVSRNSFKPPSSPTQASNRSPRI